ncbi:hypothetical protein EC973_005008 [Apophysomyces ossiformis]|uniref:Amidohydrolase-related domain-containing protein n=1 Tax=Apophysomyces ossiformis TaxID=679940 RepID=A0A8H7BKN9_9FUNG|nr:hypothetical protein EC973_005008 [Apophysomyces ossiformis]
MTCSLPNDIIDTHVHFWHPDKVFIPWLQGVPQSHQRMDADQYSKEVKNIRVCGAIYVEVDADPYHALVEADWIAQYARQLKPSKSFGGIQGIVAHAPIHQGRSVTAYLQLLVRLVGDRLRGIRYITQDPALDPRRMTDTAFIVGTQSLEQFGLSLDLVINSRAAPEQFPPLRELVSQCPRVQFVLDHMAKPPCDSQPGEAAFERWKSEMLTLGQSENVACKVSGLVTESTKQPSADQLRPFVEVAVQAFGKDRIMFGGDWPVCESVAKWQKWVELLSEIVKDWSAEDKHKLFVTNAVRIYRLR